MIYDFLFFFKFFLSLEFDNFFRIGNADQWCKDSKWL